MTKIDSFIDADDEVGAACHMKDLSMAAVKAMMKELGDSEDITLGEKVLIIIAAKHIAQFLEDDINAQIAELDDSTRAVASVLPNLLLDFVNRGLETMRETRAGNTLH